MGRGSGILQKWKTRADRAGRRDGISMAIVTCIGALLIAFSLAMAYTGSLMMANANTGLEEERAYQLAKSFSEVLEAELVETQDYDESTGETVSAAWPEFYTFARRFIGNALYEDYNTDTEQTKEDTVYTFSTTSEGDSDYGDVQVKLYKVSAGELSGGTLENSGESSYVEQINKLQGTALYRYTLVVEVVATYGESQYTYKTEYSTRELLKVKLTATDKETENGETTTTETSLYYDGTGFRKGDANGATYLPTENTTISWSYLTGNSGVISRTFVKVTAEKGDSE